MRKIPKRDPSAVIIRDAVAQRRIGDKKCVCGETRPQTFAGRKSKLCAECERKKRGRKTTDDHHVAGKANDPTMVPIPGNDHRARLSTDQMDWPKETQENRDGSPLLASAARKRGYTDTSVYLIEQLILPDAEMLETLDAYLVRTLGRKWWLKTELNQFAPKR
jgi:hypothetical protein